MVNDARAAVELALDKLQSIASGTEHDGAIYVVGGLLRDAHLGMPLRNEVDVMLTTSAIAFASLVARDPASEHPPVTYPRFGTAMVHLRTASGSVQVELVTARAESYDPASRKPDVRPGAIRDDVFRRDFTINTLIRNLRTGEVHDLTGHAFDDLAAGIIRTPLAPAVTFRDDPLRMLRAIRFASRLEFRIDDSTWAALKDERARLAPPTVAWERIRDEFAGMAVLPGPKFAHAMELLMTSGLLDRILPEMLPMRECHQGGWHSMDVWDHTLAAVRQLHDDAPLPVRLAVLWHDIGKPATRTDTPGGARFYGHPAVGAAMVRKLMSRLRFPGDTTEEITRLVDLHMRPGEYTQEWSDGSVRRLMRDAEPDLERLLTVVECDLEASSVPPERRVDLDALRARVADLIAQAGMAQFVSPLDGGTIMRMLDTAEGPVVGEAKNHLLGEVLDGRIAAGDTVAAEAELRRWWRERQAAAAPGQIG